MLSANDFNNSGGGASPGGGADAHPVVVAQDTYDGGAAPHSRRPDARATDVVVVESGDAAADVAPLHDNAASNNNNNNHDSSNGGAGGGGGLPDGPVEVSVFNRRRLGDLYPIMKDTIYEDLEGDADRVALNTFDCGGKFVQYVNNLFQYFVRNPKTMGLLLTTAIVLLFFKYSQQVVVKAVHAALSAHPGLEPSDSLRSAVLSFTHEMRSLANVAVALGATYAKDSVVGYDPASAAGSDFFLLASSLQVSFRSNVRTAVVYPLPAGGPLAWGVAGCESLSGSTNVSCFYVSADGAAVRVDPADPTTPLATLDAAALMAELRPVTDAAAGGAVPAEGEWGAPRNSTNIFSGVSQRVLTFSLPVAGAAVGGGGGGDGAASSAVVAVVEVAVSSLIAAVDMSATVPNSEVVVADTAHLAADGGQFVLDTLVPSLDWETPYGVLRVPEQRVRDIAEPIFRHNGGAARVNATFYEDGLIYSSLTMMNRWVLLCRAPLVLSAAQVQASFRALLSEYEHTAAVAGRAFRGDCASAAASGAECLFLQTVGQLQLSFGVRVHSISIAYQYNTTADGATRAASVAEEDAAAASAASAASSLSLSSSTDSKGSDVVSSSSHDSSSSGSSGSDSGSAPSAAAAATDWGVCGCTYKHDDDSGRTADEQQCYYTAPNGTETIFDGSVRRDAANVTTMAFAGSRRRAFIEAQIAGRKLSEGDWTAPYHSYDTMTGVTMNAISYVLPLAWDGDGNVTRAAVLDISLLWVPDFLRAHTHAGTTGLLLLDRRGEGTFMGSRSAAATDTYPAMQTPNHTINELATAVYREAGGTFSLPLSFHEGPQLINYQTVEPHWGVIEQIPGHIALERFLPTPKVTGATEALQLIPTGETITLFLYVGGILFAYFLNLLILNCSHLGVRR